MGGIERTKVLGRSIKACRRTPTEPRRLSIKTTGRIRTMSHRREDRVRQAVRLALMTAVSFDASMMSHLAIAADQTQSTAQSTKADELQEIVVTGFRESLETALNRKRDSNPADRIRRRGRHRQDARSKRLRVAAAPAWRFDQPLRRQGHAGADRRPRQQPHHPERRGAAHRAGNLRRRANAPAAAAMPACNTLRWKASRAKKSAASTSSRIPRRKIAKAASAASSTSRRAPPSRKIWD